MLNLREQILAASILGTIRNAQFTDWNLIEDFMKVVGLKDTDYKEYGVENNDQGLITWKDAEKAKIEREFKVSPASYELFKREVKKRNDKPGLSRDEKNLATKLAIFS